MLTLGERNVMPAAVEYRAVILFEDEIRDAARLLQAARDAPDEEIRGEILADALLACEIALQGVNDDGSILMLSRKPEPGK